MSAPGPYLWADVPPVAGSVVMATGIISIGLHLIGHEASSVVVFALAVLVWVLLAIGFVSLLLQDRRSWRARADTPPALTSVAATCVLGVRFELLGAAPVAVALLVFAAAVWPVLLTTVLRHLGRRMPGGVFLVCVATQALVVLSAVLAPGFGDWLARAGLVLLLLGLALYGNALARFDLRQVLTGAGDQWVAGGAVAISALAGSKLLASGVWSGTAYTALRTVTLVLLWVSLAWYAVLACGEAVRPRLDYDVRRWATVFPMGMTAVACLSTADAAGVSWPKGLGQVLLWVSCAAWLAAAYGLVRSRRNRTAPAAADRTRPGT
ncbi:tellurite resistance/C4-dicarboxylate transporter family protein [Streptomyces sp. NPDC048603]|uniref:tellurite resistance/C4-dicarboxylate transporter family protein n=1 Tax=Streptomyces sp. NPDC048603 TaxID=3365577 RepID=UPI0037104A08